MWWFSKTPYPKADISKVLAPYSDRMKKLLQNPEDFYSAKLRPSGHDISDSFSKDNGGAIPPNLLQISNSESNSNYLSHCKQLKIKSHPARFPIQLPEFFIKMLTDEKDLVVDIFSGSNTTGMACEQLKRRWLAIDMDKQYLAASIFRFAPKNMQAKDLLSIYVSILGGNTIELMDTLAVRKSNNPQVEEIVMSLLAEL